MVIIKYKNIIAYNDKVSKEIINPKKDGHPSFLSCSRRSNQKSAPDTSLDGPREQPGGEVEVRGEGGRAAVGAVVGGLEGQRGQRGDGVEAALGPGSAEPAVSLDLSKFIEINLKEIIISWIY